jgi:hypothetical protein
VTVGSRRKHWDQNIKEFFAVARTLIYSLYFIPCLVASQVHAASSGAKSIDLNPPVLELESPASQAATITSQSGADTLENGWFRMLMETDPGLAVREFHHRPAGASVIESEEGSPLFTLMIDGDRVDSRAFRVASRTEPVSPPGSAFVRYELESDQRIHATVEIRADEGPELRISLSLQNTGAAAKDVNVAFPMLTGIAWDSDPTEDHFFYPLLTGILSKSPAVFANAYGGGQAYFQVMASYRPDKGGGLYLNAADQTGEFKIMHLNKANVPDGRTEFGFRTTEEAMRHGRLVRELVFHDPLEAEPGTSMAFTYQQRNLEPDERWFLPTAVLGVCNGDWRQAMEAYRSWFESFAHQRPHPGKLIDRFNLEGTSAAHHFHNENGYNTDIGQWGHIPIFEGEHSREYLSSPLDMVEHTSYWEWDVVTDEYLEKHRKTAIEQAGHTNVVTSERSAIMQDGKFAFQFPHEPEIRGDPFMEGTRYFWGNQGDYGLQGYNERWGGLPAFRGYLDDMKRLGYVVTLYINVGEAALSSIIGARHGPEWGVIEKHEDWPEPRYQWPMGAMWGMDMNNPEWREYIAETCRRLTVETGTDGIRIDVMGANNPICYNDRHTHTFGEPNHQVDAQAQLAAARQVRMAVDQVDPDTVLMTENPGFDLIWQYFDGTLSYDLSEWRQILPTFGEVEGFVGINVARFYFPRFKIFDYQVLSKVPEWRIFNATGAFNREWCFSPKELAVMQENADAFGALYPKPMIPTLMPQVYANEFPAGEKTVYTIYNARNEAVEGDLLSLDAKPGTHVVDLLRHAELSTTRKGNQSVLPISLPARKAAIVARLPELAQVEWKRDGGKLHLPKDAKGMTGKLVGDDGTVLAEFPLTGGRQRLDWPAEARDQPGLVLKIHRNDRLVDAVVWPGSDSTAP